MSHYTAVVLTKSDLDLQKDSSEEKDNKVRAILQNTSDLLAPYSEEIHVEPYEVNCYCIGLKAKTDVNEQLKKEDLDINKFRKSYWAMKDEERPEWEVHIKPLVDREEELLNAHPMKGKPNPDCEECKGTGKDKSTYNPKSKWDWYVIGGRWNGWLLGKETSHNPDSIFQNMRPVKELIGTDLIPYAIITPDGEWNSRGEMGWWGISSNESDDWENQAKNIYANHQDCIAVAVDLHI